MNNFKILTISLVMLLAGASLYFYINWGKPLSIESKESKTEMGGSVFNKITFIQQPSRDIWTMKQSHLGHDLKEDEWDELMIVVDKTQNPYRAQYYQFYQGNEVEYRVSCFICHANGPRAIRPNYESEEAKLSFADHAKVIFWNLRIKSYGKIMIEQQVQKERAVPLAFNTSMDNSQLNLKSCNQCHGGDGLFSRNSLKRQHAVAIEHLVESGAMPPWPFKLDHHERQQLKLFLKGL